MPTEENRLFSTKEKLDALSNAQIYISNLLDSTYLMESEREKSNVPLINGIIGLETAGIKPLKNEVIGIYSHNKKVWMQMVSFDEQDKIENSYYSKSS